MAVDVLDALLVDAELAVVEAIDKGVAALPPLVWKVSRGTRRPWNITSS